MANGDNNEQQPNQQQMLQDFSALPDAEKQKVLAALPEGHILRDFAALPSGEQQKVLNPSATAANATRSDNPKVPLVTPLPGESFEDTMARAVQQGKATTPQDISQSMQGAGKKAAITLAAAPLAGPALATAGAIAPEAASTAVGGGIPGAMAAGATAGAGGELLKQSVTGENPISGQGAIDLGKAGAVGAATGLLFFAGGKLLSYATQKGQQLSDAVTGYRQALEEAKNANLTNYLSVEQKAAQAQEAAKVSNLAKYRTVEQDASEAQTAAKTANIAKYSAIEQKGSEAVNEAQQEVERIRASYPAGAEGEWAKTNEILGLQPKGIRVGQGADKTFGNAGRGLGAEGFTYDQLQRMKPTDVVRAITPRFRPQVRQYRRQPIKQRKGRSSLMVGIGARHN